MSDAVVVVGASLAAVRAIDSARKAGFAGSITLAGEESCLPYDRPPLSKAVLLGTKTPTDQVLRRQEWFDQMQVQLLLGQRATSLDVERRIVATTDGQLRFDRLLIATGCRARPLPEARLDGIFTLRTADDSDVIRAAFALRPRVVVIGAGFIGGEVASSARALGLDVTVVEVAPRPMSRFGDQFAEAYVRTHLECGVRVVTGAGVECFDGHGRVEAVRLTNGTSIPADLVVVGVGTLPNVEWLATSGLDVTNGVRCDSNLTAAAGVFAAGDVASWTCGGLQRRVEHWTNAAEHGVAVGALLAGGAATPHVSIPYFWSDQHGKRFQYAGGDPSGMEVLAVESASGSTLYLYRNGAELGAIAAVDGAATFMKLRRALVTGISWEAAVAMAADSSRSTADANAGVGD
jgi:NADPH-dependent 2,4-dienoyl-CoA reductase/sulfur reductase-like enzyme